MASDDLAFESFDAPRNIGTATVRTWHVGQGNYMLVGEPLVTLETTEVDPITLEPVTVALNAPFTGMLADIVAGTGDTVITGQRLAWLAHVGSGIALYRDNDEHPNNRNGTFDPPSIRTDASGLPYFDYIDVPIVLDDPPDLVGVAGEPPIQVRMPFSSPGTDNWEGTVDPVNAPTWTPLEDQIAEWAAYEDRRFGRQLVPTTFGRRENGNFIQGNRDAGDDFFVVIRTSESIQEDDNFTAGIVGWGPPTLTAVDPDTFTAPPAPWQPSDEYEKFEEIPWGSRAVGYIEILSDNTPPEPRAYTNLSGFDFLRTRATVQVETDMLYTTTETIPDAPDDGGGQPPPGQQPALEGGSGGGGGCLIATAAYGTRYEEHVVALVKFRDRYLLTNAGGTWLVKRYYSVSPRVAEFIARHEIMRAVVRQIIRPAAAIAGLCLMTSAAGKIAILFGSALVLAALMTARRKWRSVRVRV
jgi:pyruvate/2-oxoglutarate dehydrogenase complex dihydrolipoamide acyltransferase (E2) component